MVKKPEVSAQLRRWKHQVSQYSGEEERICNAVKECADIWPQDQIRKEAKKDQCVKWKSLNEKYLHFSNDYFFSVF